MSHATHLPIAAGLIVLIACVLRFQHKTWRQCMPVVVKMVAILLSAVLIQLLFHIWLLGEPRVFNNKTPVMLARVITDPPGFRYLEHRCLQPDLVICAYIGKIPDETWEFLWDEDGIWQNSPPAVQYRLLEEEMPVVLGTIATYPWEQFLVSVRYAIRQFVTFSLSEVARTSDWVTENIEDVMTGGRSHYVASRQANGTLHQGFFATVQAWTVLLSLSTLVVTAVRFRGRWSGELYALAWVIALTLLLNAGFTATLSQVADRYQGRVIWLVPLLAGLTLMSQPAGQGQRKKSRGQKQFFHSKVASDSLHAGPGTED